ncbi:hypothetical protein Metho_1197 [Methanomethylovorans hollandica DSM 15978]|uniref:Uncharacterized protein n=1 Tax=Methanomethylovorans hollandica (strain DSM 15978 / NBRC 107637 / DMS1) TaxID=867904 RepID=L0KVG9_METHD|nr:hypothetical protein [Methanomethylovorans hollandica]AGB49427.1 hypothetical protein Metho_1197 [Methanomethylovorans hollandica DSM 15978]
MKNENKYTESIVYMEMDKILEGIGIRQLPNPVPPALVERFKRAVLAKVNDNTDTVAMVGRMPEAMAMVVAAALAQRVTRFEYGGYSQVSHVIFDYSEQCPEMRV